MEKETSQELLERMAPFFGLKKAPQKGGGYRWAERQNVKRRPTKRAPDRAKSAPVCTCSMDDGIHEWNCALEKARW